MVRSDLECISHRSDGVGKLAKALLLLLRVLASSCQLQSFSYVATSGHCESRYRYTNVSQTNRYAFHLNEIGNGRRSSGSPSKTAIRASAALRKRNLGSPRSQVDMTGGIHHNQNKKFKLSVYMLVFSPFLYLILNLEIPPLNIVSRILRL